MCTVPSRKAPSRSLGDRNARRPGCLDEGRAVDCDVLLDDAHCSGLHQWREQKQQDCDEYSHLVPPEHQCRRGRPARVACHDRTGVMQTCATLGSVRLTPGTRVGPYEVVALLGAGGMAEVYRAKDTRLGRDVAIKVVSEALGTDAAVLERFEREARLAASLAHPNVVALHDIGFHDGKPYFVTELLQGETLRERQAKGFIPLAKALEWAARTSLTRQRPTASSPSDARADTPATPVRLPIQSSSRSRRHTTNGRTASSAGRRSPGVGARPDPLLVALTTAGTRSDARAVRTRHARPVRPEDRAV